MSQYYLTQEDYLMHYGVKGQKWGLRQWQNPDGSLTAAGREHYGYGARGDYKNRIGIAKAKFKTGIAKAAKSNSYENEAMTKRQKKNFDIKARKLQNEYRAEKKAAKDEYKKSKEYKTRRALAVGVAAVGTALAAYGAYKVINGKIKDHQAYERLYEAGKRATDTYNFNAPYSMISRQSNLTGKHYYNIKNIYGETIQKGSAKSLEDLHNIRDSRSRAAAIERSHAMEVARNQYFDAVSSKRRK